MEYVSIINYSMEYVSIINYSIMINGKPTKPFDAARSLRQGNPMSLFLFVIFIEYLSRCIHTLKDYKKFKYRPQIAKLKITHLCFADDLLMFSKRKYRMISLLREQFKIFVATSVIQEKLSSKSAIYFGGALDSVQHDIQQKLGYTKGFYLLDTWGYP